MVYCRTAPPTRTPGERKAALLFRVPCLTLKGTDGKAGEDGSRSN